MDVKSGLGGIHNKNKSMLPACFRMRGPCLLPDQADTGALLAKTAAIQPMQLQPFALQTSMELE